MCVFKLDIWWKKYLRKTVESMTWLFLTAYNKIQDYRNDLKT